MTQEEATYEVPIPEAGYVVFGIPDVPYSSVRIPLVWDANEFNVLVAQAMESAKLVREVFQETFQAPVALRIERLDGSEVVSGGTQEGFHGRTPPHAAPQRAAQPRQAARTTRSSSDLDPDLIVQGNCPEHGVPAVPSILKYQEVEMDDEGNERYAKYFHKLPNGSSHGLWARELV